MARNKKHKSRFSSNRTLTNSVKGRQVGGAVAQQSVKVRRVGEAKQRMLQAAELHRRRRAEDALSKRRAIDQCGAPIILGVVPANESANTDHVARSLCQLVSQDDCITEAPFTIHSKKWRRRYTIVRERYCNDQDSIDVAKVADVLLLVLDASKAVQDTIKAVQENFNEMANEDGQSVAATWFSDAGLCITDYTRHLVSLINAQGAPVVYVLLQNLHTFEERVRQRVLKLHQRYFLSVLHETTRVFSADDVSDYEAIARPLQVGKLRELKWREQHTYMVVEGGEYDEESKKLTITGYLRGAALAATQLMHLTNFGTYQIESIHTTLPNGERVVVQTSDEGDREPLQHVQCNETLEDDDGMPTESDVRFHEQQQHAKQAQTRQIRVPEGVSDYQAAWYDTTDGAALSESESALDDDGVGYDDEDGVGASEEMHARAASVPSDGRMRRKQGNDDEDEAMELDAMSCRTGRTELDFLRAEDVVRLERMTDEERVCELEKLRDLGEEEAWSPDVVSTPIDIPARQRFAKYRGLKSFRTGKWDVTENLPRPYAFIYKMQGYQRIHANALKKCEDGVTYPGQRVHITLLDVPADLTQVNRSCVLIASAQLEHEQKWSVLHFRVQRAADMDEPVKSKTPMLAHIGFRKFYVSPLLSEVTQGDRTKFMRVARETDKFCIASFFGPISYHPCPILLYQVPSLEEQAEDDPLPLTYFGAALPPDPDFVILKRVVLTGRVAVIHKKQIVVKYMFFNDEDVRWFQPVDLYTKMGRRGKITKAVGTHGLFKASLSDQVMQHDVVCMDIYKRVFPKWTTAPYSMLENYTRNNASDDNEEEGGDM